MTTADLIADRLAKGPQRGDGWHLEWATSPFDGRRFQYVAVEAISPPWAGLDDLLIARGLLSRAEIVRETLVPRPRSDQTAEAEVYAF